MSFSRDIREQALVAAARHCCVCHRYKGVKIEVHHILPKAAGGDDSLANAISLCFDCHADAGHYNPNHPRGTSFSKDELRAARDRWHTLVVQNKTSPPPQEDALYCRYIICRDWDAISDITKGDFSKFPIDKPFVAENKVLGFMRHIVGSYKYFRPGMIHGDSFTDEQTYLAKYPDALKIDKGNPTSPYFEYVRVPSETELAKIVASKDLATECLLKAGLSAAQLSRSFASWNECGTRCFQEEHLLRPLWTVFLAIENLLDNPVSLVELASHIKGNSTTDYCVLDSLQSEAITSLNLPPAPLKKGMTAIIPLGTILAPAENINENIGATTSKDIGIGGSQIFSHIQSFARTEERYIWWGPVIQPKSIKISTSGEEIVQELHSFDLDNTYAIDRWWAMGSCPHFFWVGLNGQPITYGGELFTASPNQSSTQKLLVPEGACQLLIAELEQETSQIVQIRCQGKKIVCDITLDEGQTFSLQVRPGEILELTGSYHPKCAAIAPHNPFQTNKMVSRFLGLAKSEGSRI